MQAGVASTVAQWNTLHVNTYITLHCVVTLTGSCASRCSVGVSQSGIRDLCGVANTHNHIGVAQRSTCRRSRVDVVERNTLHYIARERLHTHKRVGVAQGSTSRCCSRAGGPTCAGGRLVKYLHITLQWSKAAHTHKRVGHHRGAHSTVDRAWPDMLAHAVPRPPPRYFFVRS